MLEGVAGADGHLPRVLEELAAALERRKDLIREEGRAYPGVEEALAAIAARDDLAQSLLTGNLEANAVVKLAAFGLDRWLDFELGAFGSDPHEARSDLVAVARERAEAKLGVSRRPDPRGRHPARRPGRPRGRRPRGSGHDRILEREGATRLGAGRAAEGPERHRKRPGGDHRAIAVRPST